MIRHLSVATREMPLGDPELLDRYARGHDQAAFAALVRRYGSLVLGVARRQVADRHRAEDVFQATFLALARSCGQARRPARTGKLALHGRSPRQARKVRAPRRPSRDSGTHRPAPAAYRTGDPLDEITGRALLQVLNDELARLPDRLRLPVLLCCVQGLSREEAAQRLGCSDGVVKGRLERGRRRLAARLAARGLAPSAVLLAPLTAITVPADLLARAVERAAAPWAKEIPAAVAELAASAAPRTLLPTVVLAGCVMAVGLVGWAVASAAVSRTGRRSADKPEARGPGRGPGPRPRIPFPTTRSPASGDVAVRHPPASGTRQRSRKPRGVPQREGRYRPQRNAAPYSTVRAYDLTTLAGCWSPSRA